ncbi:MAG: c-type cytochrome [Bacteroidia bacterium]|nr:c-type cytochrome [Bacteroidia bacterium]
MSRNSLSNIRYTLVILAALLLSTFSAYAEPSYEEGEQLFKANCTACHKMQGKLVGPQLEGVVQKYAGEEEWLAKWIKNAPGLIAQGDEKAVALYEQYNKQQMQAFTNLSDDQIQSVITYIRDWEPEETGTVVVNGEGATGDPLADPGIYYALLGLVGILVLIALLLVIITATLVTAVRAKEGQEEFTFGDVMTRARGILGNKFFIATATTVIMLAGLAFTVREARTVGLHQGYMPEQPIKFSHALHAGTNQIDCKYCHTGTTKSKSAWIPSVNVCMNCHMQIQEGPQYGKEEIAKIYAAVGWDPDEFAYVNDPQPVEWVRIHNVPDHAYFNHAQHVVVGNLECQTCHGPVETMEVVYQYSDLGMGWCINCHRNEKVKVLGEETEYTVADMGGLNCARCHY